MREDYYRILEVEPTADMNELKAAYRRLAKKFHPDHNDDSPEAGEKFKLVQEAWRELRDPRKRAQYDDWLERHNRYGNMPELAEMPRHHARVSARNSYRRRSERSRAPSPRPSRVRPFLIRRVTRVSGWGYVAVCVLSLFIILPPMLRHMRMSDQRAEGRASDGAAKLAPGESPLPVEEQRRNLENYVKRLREAAENGDPHAQFKYGCLLDTGVALLGMEHDREGACYWWNKSAEQGNIAAIRALNAARRAARTPDHHEPARPGAY